MRRLLCVGLCGLLSACSWFGDDDLAQQRMGPSVAEIIAELPEFQKPEVVAAKKPTREEVMAAYRRVYGAMPEATENHAVGRRLADLEMEIGEEKDIEGEAAPYNNAVKLYESLLLNAEGENKDQIIYQLSRAHDIQGQTNETKAYLDQLIRGYPKSDYIAEARFRRAEIAFSQERYSDALQDYRYVVQLGKDTHYWQNSAYMLGWSRFKTSDLEGGLENFFSVIDAALANGELTELSSGDREVVNDSFRVVVLALAYLDGPATLAQQMDQLNKPHWQYLAYQRLAADYKDSERFLDSVATWQAFVDHNSLDIRAPQAQMQMIETLTEGDFPSQILPKKMEFVSRFGIRSAFWSAHTQETRDSYLKPLKDYLSELSKLAHAGAQESEKKADYLEAADLYEQIVATFPQDPSVAEYVFLLGEVYTEAQEHALAVAAYQKVVREFPEFNQAHEAGYAAILGLTQLVVTSPASELELWKRLKVDAQIEFAIQFPGDERAPTVQMAAADALFDLQEYEHAIQLSEHLLKTWPGTDLVLKRTAYSILGHGYFELYRYAVAETNYRQLLTLGVAVEVGAKVTEKLLAAIYKQGEEAEVNLDPDLAVYHYLRMQEVDATAELAAQGHFDAITVVEGTGRWQDAADLLQKFDGQYPGHVLLNNKDKRLANLYEKAENWSLAADSFRELAQIDADPAVRQQSLYRAAELYLQIENFEQAKVHFRDYSHTYPDPATQQLEAIHHMDLLYQRDGDAVKRRFWLEKKIALHKRLGSNGFERATYLAADAQFFFATQARAQFDSVSLQVPLKKSLRAKQKVLKKAVAAYEKLAKYQVSEFSTASTYQIADIYASLSTSILKSERPKGLSELELEQYEILLEEQAFPFEEQAISLHEINMRRSWAGTYDEWVKKSFTELGRLMPARFDKQEIQVAYVESIR